jgi:hypothetical protein
MKLDFKYDEETPGEREAYRTAVPGLVSKISVFDGAFSLLDISATGMSIRTEKVENMRPGGEAMAEIMTISQKSLLRCSVRLIRQDKENKIMAFTFINLTPTQEETLDKLVLEIQKKEVNRQKGLLMQPPLT